MVDTTKTFIFELSLKQSHGIALLSYEIRDFLKLYRDNL